MAKAKQQAKSKRGRGRPTSFSDALAARLLLLASEGATDKQLAAAAGVGLRTFMTWKAKHADFQHALKECKDIADEMVEASLFQKAVGYSHPAIKIFCHEGNITTHRYIERYAPDTTACIFWLKNRQPDRWRDRHELTGKDGEALVKKEPAVTAAAIAAAVDQTLKRAAEQGVKFE